MNKESGVVGWCLLWQKLESGWDTLNFITTLSQPCIIFKGGKRQVELFRQLKKKNFKI